MLTSEQEQALVERGYAPYQIEQIANTDNTDEMWRLLDQFEGEKLFHQGLNADQVRWIRAMPPEQRDAAVTQVQAANRTNLQSLGLSEDQQQWYNALPDDQTRLRYVAQATYGTRNPSVPNLALPANPTGPERSAKAILDNFLGNYGLTGLSDWAWERFKDGAPLEQILLEMRQRPEYKARFPAMESLAQQGRAITEDQYIEYERNVSQIMRQAGIPDAMHDQPADFAAYLTNGVSVAEVQERVQTYLSVALDEPNRHELERLYGVTPGQLAAFAMDPERALPLLERQANAALLGARSVGTGYGTLAAGVLEDLTGLGVSPSQAQETFGNLAGMAQLFNPLDTGEQAISQGTQLAAGFKGDAAARREIEARQARRKATFAGGGEYASSKEGFGGVGTAR